jgi:hypothetical protein
VAPVMQNNVSKSLNNAVFPMRNSFFSIGQNPKCTIEELSSITSKKAE